MSLRMNIRPMATLSLLMLALALGPASGQGAATPSAAARDEPEGLLDSLARQSGLRAKPVESPDFVRETRPSELSFSPVHSKRPDVPGKLLTAEELKAKERELDALKSTHDGLAKRPPSKVVYKPLEAPGVLKQPPPKPIEEPAPPRIEIPTNR